MKCICLVTSLGQSQGSKIIQVSKDYYPQGVFIKKQQSIELRLSME